MDDTCAVCAEPLEWVAYGSCGHKEVCSTCVVRLRFVIGDRRCCICKIESSTVFITKALGDYTRTINDFSIFPVGSSEGKVGSYWYHEDSQSYFDDADQYKMVRTMCLLSCSICDNYIAKHGNDGKRRDEFKNIKQLKGHLYHRHRKFMCNLCLEGRKIFISEQKLYTRAQLTQHMSTGDSEVDGSESERGGFSGHPMCEFCKNSFYGDNELFMHMSTEHYTCHICQRQHPGQYDYYKNYDDLEIHFRQEHFLCENEACLVKKFVVFQSESEMKRHNALEHAGNMSRSKRNAALQIPISFRYRRSNENEQRRGRGREMRSNSSDTQIALAIEATLESTNNNRTTESGESSSICQVAHNNEGNQVETEISPFESLTITQESEPSSLRYLQAVSQNSKHVRLAESSFPPLLAGSGSNQMKLQNGSESMGVKSTMAALLRTQHNKGSAIVLNSAQPRLGINHAVAPSSSTHNSSISISSGSSKVWPAVGQGALPFNTSNSTQSRPGSDHGRRFPSHTTSSIKANGMIHSASAPNLATVTSSETSLPTHLLNVDRVQMANKSLVEKIREALDHDENKYSSFKHISAQYREGMINTTEYLMQVKIFALWHLIPDLARLCPDSNKQIELMEAYTSTLSDDFPNTTSGSNVQRTKSRKGKEKQVDTMNDAIIDKVKELQSNYKPLEEVEVLTKGGYRAVKGSADARKFSDSSGSSEPLPADSSGSSTKVGGNRNSKHNKKVPKFHRVRLGDGSAAALFDHDRSDSSQEREETTKGKGSSDGLQPRGVWRNAGGLKLVGKTQRG